MLNNIKYSIDKKVRFMITCKYKNINGIVTLLEALPNNNDLCYWCSLSKEFFVCKKLME